MPKISSREWKETLTNILDELDKSQFNKMLELLRKIPKRQKTPKFKDKMAQIIIEHYGEEKSISAMNRVMNKIPRKDAAVQDRLRPFVAKLAKKKRKEKKDPKKIFQPVEERKTREPWKRTISDVKSSNQILDSDVIVGKVLQKSGLRTFETTDKEKPYFYVAVADETDSIKMVVYGNKLYSEIKEDSSYLFSKLNKGSDVLKTTSLSNVSETRNVKVPTEIEETARTLLSPKSPVCSIAEVKMSAEPSRVTISGTVAEERKMPPWRMSIQDLKIFGNLGEKAIAGKVVQKSGLRTYQTKNKEKKFFFYLGVADDSSSIKVMVYGRERFQRFQEESFYLFRNVIMEEDVMKVTKKSIISKTASFTVPENLEMEARMLVYSQMPVCSIAKASVAPEKTSVSVEGRVTEIRSVETIKLKAKRGKKDKQEFDLEDSTGSIGVTLWGEHIKQLRGTSHGDVVRVTNVKTSRYYDAVSLNSTAFTRIFQIQSAAVQKVTMKITGIIKASRTQTELDAACGSTEGKMFVVDSSLLAEAFGVRLDGSFEDRLLSRVPFSADVEIVGNKINKIQPAKERREMSISTYFPRTLDWMPACSIAGADGSGKKTSVSAEGAVTEQEFSSWNKLKPELNRTDAEEAPTYSLQSEAGHFECRVSGLRWVCKERTSLHYQFSSWDKHMERMESRQYMPAGPLMDITVTAGKLNEVHLPHWICIDDVPDVLHRFAVLHIDDCGDVVENVSEVTPSHVKLTNPSFSILGALLNLIFPVKISCFMLIYYEPDTSFLKLRVYLTRQDPALEERMDKKESFSGFKKIIKPHPNGYLQTECHFSLRADVTTAKIQPEVLTLTCNSQNFYEVFIKDPGSELTLELRHAHSNDEEPVWRCEIREDDHPKSSRVEGKIHFVDEHRPELIQRVSNIGPILDELLQENVLQQEVYDKITALLNSQEKMRKLYDGPLKAGDASKEVFYRVLQKHEKLLIEDLS